MALKFNCPKCNQEIIVKYLKVGESAKCRNCNAEVDIPTQVVQTDEAPTIETPTIETVKTDQIAPDITPPKPEIITTSNAIFIGLGIGLSGIISALLTFILVIHYGGYSVPIVQASRIILLSLNGISLSLAFGFDVLININSEVIKIILFVINQGLIGMLTGYLLAKLSRKSRQLSVFWFAVRVMVIIMMLSGICIIFFYPQT